MYAMPTLLLIVFMYRKSGVVLFSPKNFKPSKPPFLQFGLDKVEFVDVVKYVGITVVWTRDVPRIVTYQDKPELSTVLVISWGQNFRYVLLM